MDDSSRKGDSKKGVPSEIKTFGQLNRLTNLVEVVPTITQAERATYIFILRKKNGVARAIKNTICFHGIKQSL